MKQAKEYLQEFITKINEQDNRGTATPYYYVIRTAKYISCYNFEDGDRYSVHSKSDHENYFNGESLCEILKEIIKSENLKTPILDKYDCEIDLDDEYEVQEYLDDKYHIYSESKIWEEKGVFFTETDAKKHLKANHYHYSSCAHTYVKHAWRAPELEQFFKSVGELCGVEYKQK